ncbi:hypothetical protein PVAND_010345 [Polypedilum vanderplanki]|uniref:Carboxylic ester hydrolase n=1 Tax=Polypedilum vanderplanki TaxID=319348 RepID=A0A9J6CGC4_POLVA|nr:hypothetical protein PVAND_010345 [Polypedilum vanderplanki]
MEFKFFLVLLTNFIIFTLTQSYLVEIDDGLIEGTTMQTRYGVEFNAFLKIPFAKPPIGKLRFQKPEKNDKWNGTLNATAYGPICIQSVGRYEISEDCLHLNVFTKNLPVNNLKPVIVYIHGGSFDQGSGRNHGPLYLMERDVVLVTINYRIGALGFLSTGTADAVGNMGLKDQVMALKWIQQNIAKFGGNPNNVTITGLSAGGFSVTSHLVSEMSRGLFHRVITVSGSITGYERFESDYLDLAKYLATKVNCSTSDITAMIACMQEQSAESLMKIDLSPTRFSCPFNLDYYPVIEKDFGQERFFSEHPLKTLSNPEKLAKVQVMVGITEHEMFYLVPLALANERFMAMMNENLPSVVYHCFNLDHQPKDVTDLRTIYFGHNKIDQRVFNGLGNFFSDGTIGHGSHKLVQMISNYIDVYYYKFTYIGRYSVFNYPREKPFGMSHADDIQYVLNTWYVGEDINITDPENLMIERMTRIWAQFAWTGNPNNYADEYIGEMRWPKYDTKDEYYMEIGQHLIEKHGLFLERFSIWDQIKNFAAKRTALNLLLIIFSFLFVKLT